MHVAHSLLKQGRGVLGVDDLNPYYDPRLKRMRIAELETHPQFRFVQMDIADRNALYDAMEGRR